MNPIDLRSKSFIETYVNTALYDAGKYLEAKPNEGAVSFAFTKNWIKGDVRPIVFNYTDNSWNWGNRSLLVDLLKLAVSVFQNLSSKPPKQLTKEQEKAKKEEEEKKKKESTETQATILGTTLLLIGGFFSGKGYKPFIRYQETAKYTQQVFEASRQMTEGDLKNSFQTLVQCQLKIDSLRARKIANYFYAAVGTAIGATALVVGGVLSIHPFIRTGYLICLFSGVGAAVNAGLHYDDAEKIRKNYELIGGDKKTHNGWAQYILTCVLPNTTFQKDPAYQPLYPDLYQQTFVNVQPSAPAWDA